MNIKWLRSQIGYVGQEPILFAGSIGDNIAYGLAPELKASLGSTKGSQTSGDHEANKKAELMKQIISASKLANAHDFISEFPEGYDTDVGSNGVAMSGGQKQRIAIARALIKKPAVLLLDEATSALDATSEKVVQQSIDALAQSKAQTTIIIAHRLSTIRNADKICAISDGKIAEIGTHEELVAKSGIYADLVRLQMSSGEEETEDPHAVTSVVASNEESVENRVERARTASADAVNMDQTKEKATKGVANPEKKQLSKEQSKSVSKKVWSLIMQHPGLLVTGCFGAAVFGAVFPGWGMLLAQTQNMFYLTDPNEIRKRARLYAFYYILLAGCALFSSTAQYYGIVAVSLH